MRDIKITIIIIIGILYTIGILVARLPALFLKLRRFFFEF